MTGRGRFRAWGDGIADCL
ncbi:hypothetical protein GOE00_23960 [Sinorhizobium medicae]|nr:hypothetical protein [Sinorhizobium medicae]MDX0869774.1 hypothetical protein [Sinorhizobium medicae]